MRTYLILKEKAAQWNADPEIKSLLAEMNHEGHEGREGYEADRYQIGAYSNERASRLLDFEFDRAALAGKRLQYERLDQLTIDILLGVR
jgi:xylose isomerase